MSTGYAWVFGNDINTDLIAPARYLKGSGSIAVVAPHAMETLNPDFARKVQAGDIVVGGDNFGCGSSREQAPEALLHLGISAVVAKSFARTFYRNAMNLGLPAVVCPKAESIREGSRVRIGLEEGVIEDLERGIKYQFSPIPAHLARMLRDGGLLPHLEKRFAAVKHGGAPR